MRVLLLSAYDAQSHQHWRRSLCQGLPDWQWEVLTLPPRHFSWRVRGNALQWALESRSILEQPYDLLLATSMVDLATLRGLVPALGHVPSVLYFHENQFAYPQERQQRGLLEAQIASIYSALAADALLFNSCYNRDSFLAGVAELLGRLPDGVPGGVVQLLSGRAEVLPVPVEICGDSQQQMRQDKLQLVWNHRWEYDKGPALLLDIVEQLLASQVDFTLHVVGQQFRQAPESFQALRQCLEAGGALGEWGYISDRQDYARLLASCDVVLSTAQHDFQGLSVLEACSLACTPLVPDRLVYPEWFPPQFRYSEAAGAVAAIAGLAETRARGGALPGYDSSAFSPALLIPRYEAFLRSQAQPNSV
ncbi:MAG: DUF3524 domain-containing protein [Halieaceae bacterium]